MPGKKTLLAKTLAAECTMPEYDVTIRRAPGDPSPTPPGVHDGLGPAKYEILPAATLREIGMTVAEARANGAAWQDGHAGRPFKPGRPKYKHLRYNWLMGRKDRRDDESHGRIELLLLPKLRTRRPRRSRSAGPASKKKRAVISR